MPQQDITHTVGDAMGGDLVSGPYDILREWFDIDKKKGKELTEAMARIKEWLRRVDRRNEPREKKGERH